MNKYINLLKNHKTKVIITFITLVLFSLIFFNSILKTPDVITDKQIRAEKFLNDTIEAIYYNEQSDFLIENMSNPANNSLKKEYLLSFYYNNTLHNHIDHFFYVQAAILTDTLSDKVMNRAISMFEKIYEDASFKIIESYQSEKDPNTFHVEVEIFSANVFINAIENIDIVHKSASLWEYSPIDSNPNSSEGIELIRDPDEVATIILDELEKNFSEIEFLNSETILVPVHINFDNTITITEYNLTLINEGLFPFTQNPDYVRDVKFPILFETPAPTPTPTPSPTPTPIPEFYPALYGEGTNILDTASDIKTYTPEFKAVNLGDIKIKSFYDGFIVDTNHNLYKLHFSNNTYTIEKIAENISSNDLSFYYDDFTKDILYLDNTNMLYENSKLIENVPYELKSIVSDRFFITQDNMLVCRLVYEDEDMWYEISENVLECAMDSAYSYVLYKEDGSISYLDMIDPDFSLYYNQRLLTTQEMKVKITETTIAHNVEKLEYYNKLNPYRYFTPYFISDTNELFYVTQAQDGSSNLLGYIPSSLILYSRIKDIQVSDYYNTDYNNYNKLNISALLLSTYNQLYILDNSNITAKINLDTPITSLDNLYFYNEFHQNKNQAHLLRITKDNLLEWALLEENQNIYNDNTSKYHYNNFMNIVEGVWGDEENKIEFWSKAGDVKIRIDGVDSFYKILDVSLENNVYTLELSLENQSAPLIYTLSVDTSNAYNDFIYASKNSGDNYTRYTFNDSDRYTPATKAYYDFLYENFSDPDIYSSEHLGAYAFVELNGDDTPEMLVRYLYYWSMYVYDDGEVDYVSFSYTNSMNGPTKVLENGVIASRKYSTGLFYMFNTLNLDYSVSTFSFSILDENMNYIEAAENLPKEEFDTYTKEYIDMFNNNELDIEWLTELN